MPETFKTGKAGQWRNTGPTKGRPAKVGDLVGAESAEPKKAMLADDEYDAAWHELSCQTKTELYMLLTTLVAVHEFAKAYQRRMFSDRS